MPNNGFIHKGKRALLCGIAVGTLIYSVPNATANPMGGNVVAGDAAITSVDGTTTIQQFSDKAIIEWQDFSIDPGELTQFLQNGSNSAVLNKVISNLPSSILGQLRANGNVFLINPNGVVIGGGAQIDANSFIASTLNVANADFMAGGDLSFEGESTAAIINLGEIRAGRGDVFLLARQVKNAGKISAPQGEVGLAAGSEIYLSSTRANGSRITVKANKFAAELKNKIAVENTGAIEAARAILSVYNVDIYDLAVNNSGTIKATGLSKQADGTIRLFARGANNTTSGKIRNSGTLTAQNMDGTGGSVTISGKEIALTKSSLIDVSASATYRQVEDAPTPTVKPSVTANNRGDTGAGTILIGGDYQGKGDVATAENVTIENGSVIKANAGEVGDGGKIIVWSDKDTYAAGMLEAMGGSEAGNGGFIETSGKQTLKVDSATTIDISAINGKGGQWLLDPTDITISDGGGDVDTATINATLNGGGDVTITTAIGGGDSGDITLNNANISKTSGGDATLTLLAERNILATGTNTINSTSGALNTVFNSDSDATGGGNINLSNTIITTNGGDVIMGGGIDPLVGYAVGVTAGDEGIRLNNVDVSSGAGDISIRGQGAGGTVTNQQIGVEFRNATTLNTTTGAITIDGIGGAGGGQGYGVLISDGGTQVTSVDGNISITGRGGTNGTDASGINFGVFLNSSAEVSTTNNGSITIDGTGGAGGDDNAGVDVRTNAVVTSVFGDISITGRGGSNGNAGSNGNYGFRVQGSSQITSTGVGANAGTITILGIGGVGEDNNYGVNISGSATEITSVDGAIVITGWGGSSGVADSTANIGLALNNGTIQSTGTGVNAATITLEGHGADAESANEGIRLNNSNALITSVDGDIRLIAQGGSNGLAGSSSNHGFFASNSARVESTGTTADAATITIEGTGGAGDGGNHGVFLSVNTVVESAYGAINLVGRGGSNSNAGSNANSGIFMQAGADIHSTGMGANAATITLDGKGGAGETNNYGVRFDTSSTSITSVDGDITITGQGGSNASSASYNNYGVRIGGITVQSTGTTTDAARINITGLSGASGASNPSGNKGVVLAGSTTLVESEMGDITIRGTGTATDDATATRMDGVQFVSGATVRSTGVGANAANILIEGEAAFANGNNNHGIWMQTSNDRIETVDGDITLIGRGGSNGNGSNNRGITIEAGASIISTGTGVYAGNITLNGTGGAGEGNGYGVHMASAAGQMSVVDGDINITGVGGSNFSSSSDANYGVLVESGFDIRSTGTGANAGTITITGTGGAGEDGNEGVRFSTLGTEITSIDGDILITGTGGSNGADTSGSNDGINVYVGALIESTGTTADAAKITLTGTGASGGGSNAGLVMESQASSSTIRSAYGDITITGKGGTNGNVGSNNNHGVYLVVGHIISTGTGANAANITLNGTGGAGEYANEGVSIKENGTGLSLITTVDGDVAITGQGGSNGLANSLNNFGVSIVGATEIHSTGTGVDAGKITITGTGGAGEDNNRGINLSGAGTEITSVDGDITITGQGGSNGSSDSGANYGIYQIAGSVVSSTGTGTDAARITYNGTGGKGRFSNSGILLSNNNTAINSIDGDIILTGRGGSNGEPTASNNNGVIHQVGADIISTGAGVNAGNIIINAYGAEEDVNNSGFYMRDVGTTIESNEGDITINATRVGASTANGAIFFVGNGGDIITNNASGDISFITNELSAAGTSTYNVNSAGDITIAPQTTDTTIGIGVGAGDLQIDNTELSNFNAAGRLIIGDSVNGTGAVDINFSGNGNFLQASPYDMDFYGGSITVTNLSLSSVDSTFHSLVDDITLYKTSADAPVIQDELKNNFYTARDFIIAPNIGAENTTIGIAGGAGTMSFTEADLQGYQNIGRNLIFGDPATGSGTITIGTGGGLDLDLSGETYGIGFYGANIVLDGDIQSGGDLILGANNIAFNNYDLIADDDVVILTQNAALDIAVAGGVGGAIDITDAVIDDIFAGADGTGSLIIGDAQTGSGTINIDGLDLSGAGYGLKLYGGEIDFNGAGITTEGDLTLGADTLTNFTSVMNADGVIEVAPQTAVLMDINEPSNQFTLNGDTFSLALLNNNADAVGTEGLILGSSRGGDVVWTSATHDFTAIDARTGGDLTLTNTNAGASYGLGNGTSGGITYTTAQVEAFQIGGQLNIGSAVAGTGAIDIADLSAADTGFGLNASGGSIDIGGWNAGANDVTLLARTGNITSTEGGTITASNLNLNAAGAIGSSGNRLNTSVNQIDYITGGNVYITEATGLLLNTGVQNGAGVTDISTLDGELSLGSLMTLRGDAMFTSGGEQSDFDDLHLLTSAATGASTITIRADQNISNGSTAHTLTNTNGQALNIILNADRDANRDGAIDLDTMTITTNGGDFIAGGGSNPETGLAYAVTRASGVVIDDTTINTGAGDIILRGHGRDQDDLDAGSQFGVAMFGISGLETTTGDIIVEGEGGNGSSNKGIMVTDNNYLTTQTGAITLTGRGGLGRGSNDANENNNYGVHLNDGVTIQSTGVGAGVGDITINGTGGDGSYNAYGVRLDNTDITVNSANINITGQGANTRDSNSQKGIFIRQGSVIQSNGTGDNAGNITITGTGGSGLTNNQGVDITDSGTLISTIDGDVTITGTGGGNGQEGGTGNTGLVIKNTANILSTGTGPNAGTITLTGNGGNGSDNNYGVEIDDIGTEISSIDGDITITAQSNSNGKTGSRNNYAFQVEDAVIRSTGVGVNAANITLSGTGSGQERGFGFDLRNAAGLISSVDGDITINAQGGSNGQANSSNGDGINLFNGFQILTSGTGLNAGNIAINGMAANGGNANYGLRFQSAGTLIAAVDGDITITGTGGSNGQGANNYGVFVDNGADIRTTGTGDNVGNITITGTGGVGHVANVGVTIQNTGSEITTVDGDIAITGKGGSNGQTLSNSNYGIQNYEANIESTGSGDISLTGTGGAGDDLNYGIWTRDGDVTADSGNITYNGTAGSSGSLLSAINFGIRISNDAQIISNATGADAGTVTFVGTGGNGSNANNGIDITGGGVVIQSIDSDISLTGVGGAGEFLNGSNNNGVHINSALVTATGTGDITISGTGGNAKSSNSGVAIVRGKIDSQDGDIAITGVGHGTRNSNKGVQLSFATAYVTSTSGDILIDGTASQNAYETATSNRGVEFVNGDTYTSSVDGDITIRGRGGNGSNANDFLLHSNNSFVETTGTGNILIDANFNADGSGTNRYVNASGTGDITYFGDGFNVNANLANFQSNANNGAITFLTRDPDFGISMGGASNGLNLTDAELAVLSASTFRFGNQDNIANVINIDSVAFSPTTNVEFYGDQINVANGMNTVQDVTFATDDLNASGGIVSAGRDLFIRQANLNGTVGLGDATGQDLNLTAADFAFFDATAGRVNVGDANNNTSAIYVDNFDISSETYNFGLLGGLIDIQNGMSTGAELLAQASTGNISVNDGVVNAVGQSVFDVQQGSFKTNQGANIWNVTGGNYILYADNVLNSDILALQPQADFVYGQNSTSLTPVTIGAATDTVVLRQSVGAAISSAGTPDLIADIQALSQQPANNTTADNMTFGGLPILQSHIESPYLNLATNHITPMVFNKASAIPSGILETRIKQSLNPRNLKGIGVSTGECNVTSDNDIACDGASAD